MGQVIINTFDGGMAEDIRSHNTNECEESFNYDIFTNPHRLIPYGDSTVDSTTLLAMDDAQISDVDIAKYSGSPYLITAVGYANDSAAISAFYTKATMIGIFQKQIDTPYGAYVAGSLVVYKDKAYTLSSNGNQYTLFSFDSIGSVTAIGIITSTTAPLCRPFVHPEDNILYVVIGNTIGRWDGSTFTQSSTILPTGFETTSVTDYGTYLAISMRPARNNGNSVTYLWGRDMSLNTLQGTINFGEGDIKILENLDNNLFAIMAPFRDFEQSIVNKLRVKVYAGGAVEEVKSFVLPSTNNTPNNFKAKNGGKLYFTAGDSKSIYVLGKNKDGRYVVTKDRYLKNGETPLPVTGFNLIGDVLFAGLIVDSVHYLTRSKIQTSGETLTYESTSIYKTTINPNMPLEDRYRDKQLDSVRIVFVGAVSGTTTLKYSVDGSTMATIISEANETGQQVFEANAQSDGVPLLSGREFQFQIEGTGGAQIKEISYNYTVLPTIN